MQKIAISKYQQVFYYEWQLNPESTNYNQVLTFCIEGDLNVDLLLKALTNIPKSIEGLSSYFLYEDNEVKQVLDPDAQLTPCFIDLSLERQKKQKLYKYIVDFQKKLFNLHQYPLSYICLIKFELDKHYLVFNIHHAVCDGLSVKLLVNEVNRQYQSLIATNSLLPPTQSKGIAQYIEYEQQNNPLLNKKNGVEYFLKLISDAPLSVNLAKLSNIKNHQGRSEFFIIDESLKKQLQIFARKNKTTVNIIISCVFCYLLHLYSHQKDIIFTYPINIRPGGYFNIFGSFINTIINKVSFDKALTVKEVIKNLTLQRKSIKPYNSIRILDIIDGLRDKEQAGKYNNIFNISIFEAKLTPIPLAIKPTFRTNVGDFCN